VRKKEAVLIIAASEKDANLYYVSGFIAPDPFVFIQAARRKFLLMSDLEVDRARAQSKVDRVLSISGLVRDFEEKRGRRPSYLELISDFLNQKGVRHLLVPADFPTIYADALRKRNFKVTAKPDPFFGERTIKSPREIAEIEKTLRHTEAACRAACEVIARSRIQNGKLYSRGKLLTSEAIKKVINVALMERGCVAQHTIIACGLDGVDPHNEGSGPLYANQAIVMDIFPQSVESRYFADLSRTVVRGKASPKLKKMYAAVREGQEIAFQRIRAGADGSKIHRAIQRRFEELGFPTGEMRGRVQGFFHGTGHGVGLEIHEPPRISVGRDILKAGQVVTVEPGLYYEDAGGIRLEDMVLVTRQGCRNLTRLPKVFEL
jgi:Xaa-Pro aminopeptidase